MTMDYHGQSSKLAEVNKVRTANGFYLFTEDFGATTKNTLAGVDVILTPQHRRQPAEDRLHRLLHCGGGH